MKDRGPTPDVEVYDIGTTVKVGTKGDEIKAAISEISISNGAYIRYRVVWWDGRERHEEWVEQFEVVGIGKTVKPKIGFIRSQ